MGNHIKTAFGAIRRTPFQAIAAISILSITFFVTSFFAVLLFSTYQVLSYFETRPQIIAFLKDDPREAQTTLLNTLKGDSRVIDVVYISKEEALEIYKEATADNPLLGELVSPSTFPASIEFSVVDLAFADPVLSELEGEEIVDSVSFTATLGSEATLTDVIGQLKKVFLYLRIAASGIVGILAFTSFLVLTLMMGMRIAMRKSEVETLSLIGATRSFIRTPIMIEAVAYAIIGVVIGWLTASVMVMYATPAIFDYFGEIPVLPKDTPLFFGLFAGLLAVEVFLGVVIALLGSIVAVARSLKRKS